MEMASAKKIIGFDLDGVIIDHTYNKVVLAKDLGIELKIEHTPSDIMKRKLLPEVWKKIQRNLYDDPRVAFSAPLVHGVTEGLDYFKKNKITYYLISRRKFPGMAVKLLKVHGLWSRYFSRDNVFFVKEKTDKNIKAKELNVMAYIDDQPSVLKELVSVKHRFLLDPLRAYKPSSDYKIVRSWQEFITHLS